MELKEGMYVRTKDGTIDKITKDEYGVCSCPSSNSVYCEHHILATFIITKASYNIIDLIEVGDYVNGYKVVHNALENRGNIIIFDNGLCVNNNEIKSIVTKEQFKSMSYKVGE